LTLVSVDTTTFYTKTDISVHLRTYHLSPRAKLRPRLLVTSRRLFRHPRSKSAPAKISWFLAAGPAWKQDNCRLSHPFLIIRKIGCRFPLSLRRRKASLTVDRLQQGEPSPFGSSSAQCKCGTLPILDPIEVTLFTGRPNGSKKKRRSCAILWWSLSYRGTQTPIVSISETKNRFVLSRVSLSETSQHWSSSWLVLPSISSSYHTRRSSCSKIGPCGCLGSSNLLAAKSTISSIKRFRSPFYWRKATYGFAGGACCSTE